MATVYLSLGTNLGDREKNLRAALVRLSSVMHVEMTSSIYESEPIGARDQPFWLYRVCSGRTFLSPADLLRRTMKIEKEMGRPDGFRTGPRPMDIDLLFYDRLIELSPILTIPHPRLHERAFILIPLTEIAPYLIHPRLRMTMRELLTQLKAQ